MAEDETRSTMPLPINIMDRTTINNRVALHHRIIRTHFPLRPQVGLLHNLVWLVSLVDLHHHLLATHHTVGVNSQTTTLNHPAMVTAGNKDMVIPTEAGIRTEEAEDNMIETHTAEITVDVENLFKLYEAVPCNQKCSFLQRPCFL